MRAVCSGSRALGYAKPTGVTTFLPERRIAQMSSMSM